MPPKPEILLESIEFILDIDCIKAKVNFKRLGLNKIGSLEFADTYQVIITYRGQIQSYNTVLQPNFESCLKIWSKAKHDFTTSKK